jgi:hypothetical protein
LISLTTLDLEKAGSRLIVIETVDDPFIFFELAEPRVAESEFVVRHSSSGRLSVMGVMDSRQVM